MIISNIKQVKKDWEKTTGSLDAHAMHARDEMMNALVRLTKGEIQGERGVVGREIKWVDGQSRRGKKIYGDDPAIPGQPPKNRTGNLRRSIHGIKKREGFGTYTAIIGPGVIYGRHLELGGGNWPQGVKFPFMEPAWRKFQPIAREIIKKHFSLGRI